MNQWKLELSNIGAGAREPRREGKIQATGTYVKLHLSLSISQPKYSDSTSNMGRGKFKGKPTGHRNFSTHEELISGSSSRPRTFKREEVREDAEEESEEEIEKEEEPEKRKGTLGLIEIENPNLVKPKNLKAGNVDMKKTTELSRRERVSESASTPINGHLKDFKCNLQACSLCNSQSKKKKEEIEKKRAHERYMRLQEQGKTEQARKDIERLALIRQQRAEAARKRGEEKAAKEQKKGEARKAEIKKKPSI
ncbi:28 kDa heat- and acid-stable phosphoprotein-like isoform X2 [Carya illinoinensis]|uniref:28 kDa heat- and acid-stable phosphoprotein-like isoform X2 n=1 Tax=Carya illinoinensis TaxID=32201 RepID=UPI001C7203E7|nr:28 kDa heat- and acid-stable phosphoprotein-like isoform X2 [Carya illinoinensis]